MRETKEPTLYLVVPCYNEQDVLPATAPIFLEKLKDMIRTKTISNFSHILFVDDGSTDRTWEIIKNLTVQDSCFLGISLSRNWGQQNSVLAGLMEAKENCDITVSMDCDGQDDIDILRQMVSRYRDGYEVVYGVRSKRTEDSFWKRFTAETYYKLLKKMGVETIFNHAEYRLLSSQVLQELEKFREVNLYLRGLIPYVGHPSTRVFYERKERKAGKTHYSLYKMLLLAFDGITSLTIKPIQMITRLGGLVTFLSFGAIVWAITMAFMGNTVSGWTSLMCVICFLGGLNLMALGLIGQYVGRTYMEAKHRPRYIIREKTYER